MSEHKADNGHDFVEQVTRIKQKRASRNMSKGQTISGDSETIQQVMKILNSVVQDFLKADESLFIQSSDTTGFFVSYGYTHICRVWIVSASPKSVEIALHGASTSTVYSGELEDKNIEKALKDALLQWYGGLF